MTKNKRNIVLTGMIAFLMICPISANYSIGDSGDAVKQLQRQLTKAGCLVKADGKFNGATEEAVRKFQKNHHLAVDGIIGPDTYKALTGKSMQQKSSKKSMSCGNIKKVSLSQGIDDRNVKWRKTYKISTKVKGLVEEAQKCIGVPYRFGGTELSGFDCSGFMQYIFNKKGITLPRAADEQFAYGKNISVNLLEPGDLVFFTTYESGVSHSGMYLGDGYFISATTSQGVAIATLKDGYWHDRYLGARRVL